MTRVHSATAILAALGLAIMPGCSRRPAVPPVQSATPAQPPSNPEYCWWTALRSSLPPDSVAARFEQAFAALGFTGVTRGQGSDTTIFDDKEKTSEPVTGYVLAHAGPTLLAGEQFRGTYEAWAIAWVRNDTTRIRYYLNRSPRFLDLCGALWRAAMQTDSALQETRSPPAATPPGIPATVRDSVIDRLFVAWSPAGRALDPITKTNWESTGVRPDIAVPADSALAAALADGRRRR